MTEGSDYFFSDVVNDGQRNDENNYFTHGAKIRITGGQGKVGVSLLVAFFAPAAAPLLD